MSRRVRDYHFVLNNYTDEEVELIKQTPCRYIIFGKEVAPTTGTPHLQGYVYFEEKKTMVGVQKIKGWKRTALKEARGDADQNKVYCSKDKIVFEKGDKPTQGKRKDLDEVYEELKNGKTTVDKIVMEHPGAYKAAGRVLDRMEDILLRDKFRTEMTEGEWVYGGTGVGKSEYAFQAPCSSRYIWPNDNGWWDGYKGQELVILDEYRGQLPYNEILKMVDKHPNYFVRRRGREPLPFISKKVIITSSMAPWEIYKNLDDSDSLDQLYRRFKIYNITKDGCFEINPKTKEPYLDEMPYKL